MVRGCRHKKGATFYCNNQGVLFSFELFQSENESITTENQKRLAKNIDL